MPKRQAKVIYKASKKHKKSFFSFKAFSLQVLLGFFIALVIFAFENVSSQAVSANRISSPSAVPLLSTAFLFSSDTASTSPEFTLPITQSLEQSIEGEISSEAASIAPPNADYCLDVPVVLYHHIQPLQIAGLLGHALLTVDSQIFDDQMKYLSENGYNAISGDDLVHALLTHGQLPKKSVMITIDDGYDDNYTYAFLTAKKYQLVMNFMIPTSLIDKPGYMNWDHLREMARSPYARIYNHTGSHAALGYLTKDKIIEEITIANTDLQTKLGITNDIVTYPYGSYTEEAMETLKQLGIKAAFTTDPGTQHCLSTIMKLPRLRVGNSLMSDYGY